MSVKKKKEKAWRKGRKTRLPDEFGGRNKGSHFTLVPSVPTFDKMEKVQIMNGPKVMNCLTSDQQVSSKRERGKLA